MAIKFPAPYFGGKSAVAPLVWERFGDTPNYVEPFAGSLAVLLGRPHEAKTETVNDLDGFIANAFRALKYAPGDVAEAADWPVSEVDLHSRHAYLMRSRDSLTERMMGDHRYFDAELAGFWIWGACAWIGSGWCSGEGPWQQVETPDGLRLQKIGNAGQGINRQLPHVGNAGQGINRQLPHVGDGGKGNRRAYIESQFFALSERLRDVRVLCGDWSRAVTPSVTERHGMSAVFLDPPYSVGAMNYSVGGNTCDGLAQAAAKWAIENGDNPLLRICYAGYEGVVEFPASWECVEWVSKGGYGGGRGNEADANRQRERLWFNKSCLRPFEQPTLF